MESDHLAGSVLWAGEVRDCGEHFRRGLLLSLLLPVVSVDSQGHLGSGVSGQILNLLQIQTCLEQLSNVGVAKQMGGAVEVQFHGVLFTLIGSPGRTERVVLVTGTTVHMTPETGEGLRVRNPAFLAEEIR